MADHPEIAKAKARMRALVPNAVETVATLMQSEHDGIRLAASKEVLDRGGLPAKQDHTVSIDITLDDEIEQLLASLGRNRSIDREKTAADYTIEDAIVVEPGELEGGTEPGEPEVTLTTDRTPVEVEPEPEEEEAWWQANQT